MKKLLLAFSIAVLAVGCGNKSNEEEIFAKQLSDSGKKEAKDHDNVMHDRAVRRTREEETNWKEMLSKKEQLKKESIGKRVEGWDCTYLGVTQNAKSPVICYSNISTPGYLDGSDVRYQIEISADNAEKIKDLYVKDELKFGGTISKIEDAMDTARLKGANKGYPSLVDYEYPGTIVTLTNGWVKNKDMKNYQPQVQAPTSVPVTSPEPAPVVAAPVTDTTPPAPVVATPPAPVAATPPAPVAATPPALTPYQQKIKKLVDGFGANGWAKCAVGQIGIEGLIKRGDNVSAEIKADNQNLSKALGAMRQYMLSNGTSESTLNQLAEKAAGSMKTGDQALAIQNGCVAEMNSILK